MEKRRGLAFYKESGENWTAEEYVKVLDYCGDITEDAADDFEDEDYKYIYDDGTNDFFMHTWTDQTETDVKDLTKISYESVFSPVELKKFKVK